MSSAYIAVDLSALPAPQIVDPLDFDTIFADMLAQLISLDSTFTALVESDPAYKILQVAAYREVLLRQRVNEAAQALLLAYAEDGDLDQIAAGFDVERLTITPADNTTVPPTPAVMELDDALRARVQQSFEGFTSAGPVGAYQFFALSSSGLVLDVSVTSPTPGTVQVTLLHANGDGGADNDPNGTLLNAVTAALSAENVRPLCDTVVVAFATILPYSVNATLEIDASVDQDAVLAMSQSNMQAYADSVHKCGGAPTLAGVYAALWATGVQNVVLNAGGIQADMVADKTEASYCTGITIAGEAV
ncbi:baseplate J/gp47 family protein [Paraburkholderia sp. J12]|uniref:baseplate assembly protein n=1 Tax=Paraburkholderia sp. J12 TaxID=2805432 RepID=UPI002ABDFB4E|nr:baseplate J/gp47 family protein [Paraburkholderia sp. J12]